MVKTMNKDNRSLIGFLVDKFSELRSYNLYEVYQYQFALSDDGFESSIYNYTKWFSPNVANCSMIGKVLMPFSDSVYSTFGGIWGKDFL